MPEQPDQPQDQGGRPLALDPDAASRDASLPGFLARPDDAPVYHGFRILEDVDVEGFKLGLISELGQDCGDAFVVAPDSSRAGLVWEIFTPPYFREISPPEQGRWGVWAVAFADPMNTHDDARRNLTSILPELRARWEAWRSA